MSEFRNIRVLIIDPGGHSKAVLRSLLINLGVLDVSAVATTGEALKALREGNFSIVFCDEFVGPADPYAFLRLLRRDLGTMDVTVPVVLVSSKVEFAKFMAARDAGTNDVIAKPVSASTIERKLRSLLLTPKPFVTTKEFVGPDRRRAGKAPQTGKPQPAFEERRGRITDRSVFALCSRLAAEKPEKA